MDRKGGNICFNISLFSLHFLSQSMSSFIHLSISSQSDLQISTGCASLHPWCTIAVILQIFICLTQLYIAIVAWEFVLLFTCSRGWNLNSCPQEVEFFLCRKLLFIHPWMKGVISLFIEFHLNYFVCHSAGSKQGNSDMTLDIMFWHISSSS